MSATGARDEPAPGPAVTRMTVRLYAAGPQTVLARVAGPVDESSTPLFAETVAGPFGMAVHVVVDLTEVTALTSAGIRALLDLDRAATRHGTQLHITGIRGARTAHHVAGHLLRLAADHLLQLTDPAGPAEPAPTRTTAARTTAARTTAMDTR